MGDVQDITMIAKESKINWGEDMMLVLLTIDA